MAVQAVAKYVRISPTKVRPVADLIRGKNVEEALHILRFTRKAAARPVSKVVNSAVANAKQRGDIDVDTLYISTICVDQGPVLKRFRPAPMGRAHPIRKRTSHIKVVLEEE
ncbi:MAG: 50S ribosomal protein L22 [Deltaproteobacteria bacterium]|nr:MAG: 50S ribosomal protein L22 [Deltaproteobacteria bacterium]